MSNLKRFTLAVWHLGWKEPEYYTLYRYGEKPLFLYIVDDHMPCGPTYFKSTSDDPMIAVRTRFPGCGFQVYEKPYVLVEPDGQEYEFVKYTGEGQIIQVYNIHSGYLRIDLDAVGLGPPSIVNGDVVIPVGQLVYCQCNHCLVEVGQQFCLKCKAIKNIMVNGEFVHPYA